MNNSLLFLLFQIQFFVWSRQLYCKDKTDQDFVLLGFFCIENRIWFVLFVFRSNFKSKNIFSKPRNMQKLQNNILKRHYDNNHWDNKYFFYFFNTFLLFNLKKWNAMFLEEIKLAHFIRKLLKHPGLGGLIYYHCFWRG